MLFRSWLAVALVMISVLKFVFKLLEYTLQSGTGYEIICDERLRLGKKLLNLSMEFYQDMDAGNISSVINNDLVFVESMAMNFISKIVGEIISAVIMMVVLFVLDWHIAYTRTLLFLRLLLHRILLREFHASLFQSQIGRAHV